jgi:tRNA(Ile)-lysidine synthetase-like protein
MGLIKLNRFILEKPTQLLNNRSYVIMCSGGVDSIAAAHYLHNKFKKENVINFRIFHYNHKLRPQNDKMQEKVEDFVANECATLLHILNNKSKSAKPFTEDKLRQLRMESICEIFHKHTVVTAHHLDDCVESYLMNCFRGHTDYQPIPFFSEIKNEAGTTNIITHPFLFTKKQDFIDYAIKHNLMKYVVEDETNSVTKGSRRNMIRNQIVPILKQEQMGIDTIVKKKMNHRLMLEMLK